MPTYNRAYIIERAIKSIQVQTVPDWELIVIDDGSTDDTRQIVEKINDPRIRHYSNEKNEGVVYSRNRALELVRGDWTAYLDSDDELLPDYIEVVFTHLKKHKNIEFILPRGNRLIELYKDGKLVAVKDETKEEYPATVNAQDIVHRKVHGMMPGFMHSRRVVEEGIRFDLKAFGSEDWELMLTLCEKYPNGFLYVPEILFTYHMRFGGDGIVSNHDYDKWAPLFEYIYQKHKNDTLMQGQTWYPDRVLKWRKLAEDYKKGLIPEYQLYYFKEFWSTPDKKKQ